MTNIAMETQNRGWNLGFATARVEAARVNLRARYRRWRQHRATMAELDQYSAEQLIELGIAPSDIARIAQEATAAQLFSRKIAAMSASRPSNVTFG